MRGIRGEEHYLGMTTFPEVAAGLSAPTPRAAIDDATLLARIGDDDKSAFGLVYDRHIRSVHAFSLTRLERREDAEEVTQDTFVTLWRRRRSITLAGDSLLPWLLVTSKNLVANRRRALDVHAHRHSDTADNEPIATKAPGPEYCAEVAELRAMIASAVDALSTTDKEIFSLCVVDGRSYDVAAALLGISSSAIRNRLSRLRTHLRSELRTLKGTP